MSWHVEELEEFVDEVEAVVALLSLAFSLFLPILVGGWRLEAGFVVLRTLLADFITSNETISKSLSISLAFWEVFLFKGSLVDSSLVLDEEVYVRCVLAPDSTSRSVSFWFVATKSRWLAEEILERAEDVYVWWLLVKWVRWVSESLRCDLRRIFSKFAVFFFRLPRITIKKMKKYK